MPQLRVDPCRSQSPRLRTLRVPTVSAFGAALSWAVRPIFGRSLADLRRDHVLDLSAVARDSRRAAGSRARQPAAARAGGGDQRELLVPAVDRPMRTERLDSGSRMQRLPDTEVEVELHPGLLLVQLVRKRDVDDTPLDDGPCAFPSAQVVEQIVDELRL